MANQIIPDTPTLVDLNGDILAGGSVAFYRTGTTIPVELYSDDEGTIPAANPVDVDAGGRMPQVFYIDDFQVKAVIMDSIGAALRTIDPCQTAFAVTGNATVATVGDLADADQAALFVSVLEVGRAGVFDWRAGDYSEEVAADTLGAIYVASNGTASTSGAWVRRFDGRPQAAWFGVLPLGVASDAVTDITANLQAMTDFLALFHHSVEFAAGHYFFNKWTIDRRVAYYGLGAVNNVRTAVTSGDEYDDLMTSKNGATFIAMGNDAIIIEVDGCSDGENVGYVRDFSTATVGVEGYDDIHPSSAAPFTKARLFDGSNRDASGATRATLKQLRCAVVVTDSFEKLTMRDIKIVSSNPGSGETYGLGGYADSSIVAAIPDYDIGLFYRNAVGVDFERVQIVGYWREIGTLNFLPPADGFTSVTADNEQGLISRCVFQSGLAFRSGDLFPVVDKTSSAIYVRWSASHRFPATGTVNISNGDTFNNSSEYTYTALAYSTAATPNTAKTGEFLVFSIADTSALEAGDKIEMHIGQGGSSHTQIEDCRITGFDHHTGLDQAADDLAAYTSGRYTPALEISGAPMRAVKFENCVINSMSPVLVHVGAARDLEFDTCYSEAKSFKWKFGESLQTSRGGVFIAGPTSAGDYTDEIGAAGSARIYFELGGPWNSTVSFAPYIEPRAGRRLSTMTDVFNPIVMRMDPWLHTAADKNQILSLMALQEYRIMARETDYSQVQMMRLWRASGDHLLDLGGDGAGGHLLRLRSNGTIDITGAVTVTGDLTLNGSLMMDGNQVIDPQGGGMRQDVSDADIRSITSAINTVNKRDGKEIICTPTNKKYTSLGGAPGSKWSADEGTDDITPA